MSEATCRAAPPGACVPAGGRAAAPEPGLWAWREIAWFATALARPWRRHATIRELHRLSDRELRDIGIERGQVEDVVDELMAISPEP